MIKLTISTLVYLCCTVCFTKGTISKTELIGVNKYIDDVFQLFVHALEDEGMCNLRMRDFSATINQTMYGDVVLGDLRYFNGFVLGVDDLLIKPNSVSPFLNELSMVTYINAVFLFNGLRFSYDMQAHLTNTTQNATGIFQMDSYDLSITITKDLKTGAVTSKLSATGSAQSHRIDFQPKNYYTTVIAREFSALNSDVSGSFSDFADGLLSDILTKIVVEKVAYPDIDYDTFEPRSSRVKSALKFSKSH